MKYDQLVHAIERELERLGHDELEALPVEQQRVIIWRVVQFVELGFGEGVAVALAQAGADVGSARVLIGAGCSPEIAARILL